MPINGFHEVSIPRIGKIRTGKKTKSQKGTEYPIETDYFVITPQEDVLDRNNKIVDTRTNIYLSKIIDRFGNEPRELPITLPTGNKTHHGDWECAPQFLKWYAKDTKGRSVLMCKGDNNFAHYKGNQNVPGLNIPGVNYPAPQNRVCNIATCPQAQPEGNKPPKCKALMTFSFLIPEVTVDGVFAIDTSSLTAMRRLLDTLEWADKAVLHRMMEMGYLKRLSDYRGLGGVPLILYREKVDNSHGGSNFPLCIRIDDARLDEQIKKAMQNKASTLISMNHSEVYKLEAPRDDDVDELIVNPTGDIEIIDEKTGEILGPENKVNNKVQAKLIEEDEEVIAAFKKLGQLKNVEVSLGTIRATANKFVKSNDQRGELIKYLNGEIEKLESEAQKTVETTGKTITHETTQETPPGDDGLT